MSEYFGNTPNPDLQVVDGRKQVKDDIKLSFQKQALVYEIDFTRYVMIVQFGSFKTQSSITRYCLEGIGN